MASPYGSVKFTTVEEYLAAQPAAIRPLLEKLRTAIKQAAPKAQEVISYNMPGYKVNSVLVYFAAAKSHIGFYPTPSPIQLFKEELKHYQTSKGAIQFSLEKDIPVTLVKKIVKYRLAEDAERAKAKAAKKK